MSGHSKWANIKVRKGAQDKKRSAIFTRMAKDIIVAVKRGGGITNPSINSFLRSAIDKSREVNMPKENVERLLKKFEERGDNLVNIYLEGFGPENIPVVIEVETDNKIRTSNNVRHVLQEYSGGLADNNAVMFQFEKVGRVELSGIAESDWEKLIDIGANDIYDNYVEVDFSNLGSYVSKLEKLGFEVIDFGAFLKAKMPMEVKNKDKLEDFVDLLMELDDVINVFVASL